MSTWIWFSNVVVLAWAAGRATYRHHMLVRAAGLSPCVDAQRIMIERLRKTAGERS